LGGERRRCRVPPAGLRLRPDPPARGHRPGRATLRGGRPPGRRRGSPPRAGTPAAPEPPQQDAAFARIRELAGIDPVVRHYEETLGRELEVIDLRREAVVFRDGILTERPPLAGR